MSNNKLIIAAAGSGKTTYLVDQALSINGDRVLITTFTEVNEREIRNRIVEKKGYMPSNITVKTWFSFLLQHGVRPYQSALNDSIHENDLGFFLTSKKSGQKLDKNGKPITNNQGIPLFWGEKDFQKFYFTHSLKIYSDKISKFVFNLDKKTDGEVLSRISRIYKHIYIDEVQDLAGFDLDIIKLLFKSNSSIFLVGDPRQVTYLTHHSAKYGKYTGGGIKGKSFKDLIGDDDENGKKEVSGLSKRELRKISRHIDKVKLPELEEIEEKEEVFEDEFMSGGSTLSQLLRPGQSFKSGGKEDHDVQEYDISDSKTGEVVAKTTGQEDHMVNEDGTITVMNSDQNESIHDAFKDVDVEMVLKALEKNPQKGNIRQLLTALNKVFSQKQFQS